MRQPVPMRWIEQVEARQVMTDALFQRAARPSWCEMARKSVADWLPRRRDPASPSIAAEWPLLQPVRVADCRTAPARDEQRGYYC